MSDRTPETQDEPVQRGATEASRSEQIRGILAQVQEDLRLGHVHDEGAALRQRLDEAGIPVPEEELERYLEH